MLRSFSTIFFLFLFKICSAQQPTDAKGVEKILTPSPTVSSLGNYGGLDEKRNTGAVQKTIPLLSVKEGSLSYEPSLTYFSNGVKVDDWGSRTGIGWTENITAVVSRTVRGVPDERAKSRVGDGQWEFGTSTNPDTTDVAYQKMFLLNRAPSTTELDGEYDLFNYNLFGLSGSFIIKNNAAILLNHKEGIKIQIVSTSPTYQFLITSNDGVRYYFNSTIEYTNYSTENLCDQDQVQKQDVATAWFVNKVISANSEALEFSYNAIDYKYVYDYSEKYGWFYLEIGGVSCFDTDAPDKEHIYCAREKVTKTHFLTAVRGKNFNISYDYINREDIIGEKLLKSVTLSTAQGSNSVFGLIKQIDLDYEKVTASSQFEELLSASINGSEQNSLRIRYFLSALKIGTAQMPNNQVYNFNYINLNTLPHRFSFAQDYMGFYNGKTNASFVPDLAKETLMGSVVSTKSANPPQGAFANRRPDVIGKAGLLFRIKYPTGGVDSIIYEPNQFQAVKLKQQTAVLEGARVNNSYSVSDLVSQTIKVPFSQDVKLELHCLHADNPHLVDDEGEGYNIIAQLWDKTHNRAQFLPFMVNSSVETVQLKLNQSYQSSNYSTTLSLQKDITYELRFSITGYRTQVNYSLKYTSSKTNVKIDTPFYGYRLKKLYSKAENGPLIKSYNYNLVKKNGADFVLTDSTAIVTRFSNSYITYSLFFCGTGLHVPANTMYWLNSKSNDRDDVFNGFPYAYTNITEFMDENEKSFVSSQYVTSANGQAGSVFHEFPGQIYSELPILGPELNNSAWDCGIETKRYHGGRRNGKLVLDREQYWKYSTVSQVFFNYSAYRLRPGGADYGTIGSRVLNYRLKSYETFSNWYKLDTLREVNYFHSSNGYKITSNSEKYRYNTVDKLLEEKESYDSKSSTIITRLLHPGKIVSLGKDDAAGTYQGMVDNNIINPVIDEITLRNNNQISLKRLTYRKTSGIYNSGSLTYFLPASFQTQARASDPIEDRLLYERYDNLGNLLSVSNKDGVSTCFVWGYGGKYLIAKIENAKYGDLITALGGESAIEAFRNRLSPSDQEVINFIQQAKNSTSMKDAMFSIYTHKPLLGLVDVIDTKGVKTHYDYDQFGNLFQIRDQAGKIVKQLQYNYSNHSESSPTVYGNEEITRKFVRNNCTGGSIGGDFTYTIPAGKYISMVSVEAANALAEADISTNGQPAANASQGCTVNSDSYHLQLLFYNGLSKSIPVRLVYKEENITYNLNILPGTTNLGSFAQAGAYAIELPYIEEIITGKYHFSWNCSLVDKREWKLINGKMYLDMDVEFSRQDCNQIQIVPY